MPWISFYMEASPLSQLSNMLDRKPAIGGGVYGVFSISHLMQLFLFLPAPSLLCSRMKRIGEGELGSEKDPA